MLIATYKWYRHRLLSEQFCFSWSKINSLWIKDWFPFAIRAYHGRKSNFWSSNLRTLHGKRRSKKQPGVSWFETYSSFFSLWSACRTGVTFFFAFFSTTEASAKRARRASHASGEVGLHSSPWSSLVHRVRFPLASVPLKNTKKLRLFWRLAFGIR